jgi:hypothetical protein
MALIYLVNKPHVFWCITQWLFLFLEYDFQVVYKSNRSHTIVHVLSQFLNVVEPIGVLDQVSMPFFYYNLNGYNSFLIVYK